MRQIRAKVAVVSAKVESLVGIHSMGFNSTPVVRRISSTKKYTARAKTAIHSSMVPRLSAPEIIPNSVSSVLIMATTDIGNKILMFSTLSFLGLGSAPPTPEWGMMVSDGVDYFNKFWVAGFPGLAIFTMAVGANFIGDGLRDLLDPKLRTQF